MQNNFFDLENFGSNVLGIAPDKMPVFRELMLGSFNRTSSDFQALNALKLENVSLKAELLKFKRLYYVYLFLSFAFLFIFSFLFPRSSHAQVFKCGNGSSITYQTSPCKSGSFPYSSIVTGGSGSLSLTRGQNNSFNVSGTVSALPVSMLVDTGASFTSISGRLASRLGVRSCEYTHAVNTAAGVAGACSMRVDLRFGQFQFTGHEVLINLNMPLDVLLGNDLLKRFKLEQVGDVLTLSR